MGGGIKRAPRAAQVAKFEMRGPEYVPKKKAKKQKKGAKADKALSWGGFDDQVKATQVGRAGHSLTPRT